MKKTILFVSALAVAASALISCNNPVTPVDTPSAADSTAVAGSIVFFNIDKVMEGYDMANDLRSVVETKVSGIQAEIDRRGNKLQKDINDFQNKIEKGLLTRSVAEVQQEKLQKQQNDYQQFVMKKQNEMAEEQQVMLNQIADAIAEYVKEYNAEKNFAMILTTSGDILSAPVVVGNPTLDITDELLKGLNEAYVKTKAAEK